MKIALGADHKGVELKARVGAILKKWGHEVIDFGTNSEDSVDYPDFGLKVARAVASHEVDRGVTICWTGNGMNIVANKVNGVRAGLALNPEMAELTRAHNDANVLTLSGKYTPDADIEPILKLFIETPFEGGRHTARVDKITAIEQA